MIELYPFQESLIKEISQRFAEGKRRVCLQLPTGGGKTVIAGWIAESAHSKGKKTLVLVHRQELLHQFYNTLQMAGLAAHTGFIRAGQPTLGWHSHQIASVQTLSRRLEKTSLDPDLIFVDEAHHGAAKTYMKILNRFPRARVVGLTATPERLDGLPLAALFDDIVAGPSPRELIDQGYLSKYEARIAEGVKRPENKTIRAGEYRLEDLDKAADERAIANVAEAIWEYANEKKCIIFSSSVRASEELAVKLNSREPGSALHIDGKTSDYIRSRALRDFSDGRIKYICNVNIVSEGFDCPACDCVVMARPTASLTIFLQQIGRALRFQPEKKALILDCAANIEIHGSPCAARSWSLQGRQGSLKSQLRSCPFCRKAFSKAENGKCPNCGAVVSQNDPKANNPQKAWNQKAMPFFLYDPETSPPILVRRSQKGPGYVAKDVNFVARQAYRQLGLKGLQRLGDELGYKKSWAFKRMQLIDSIQHEAWGS